MPLTEAECAPPLPRPESPHLDVDEELLLRLADVADGDADAQHLFQLELDRRARLVHLALDRLVLRHQRRELAGLEGGRQRGQTGGAV